MGRNAPDPIVLLPLLLPFLLPPPPPLFPPTPTIATTATTKKLRKDLQAKQICHAPLR